LADSRRAPPTDYSAIDRLTEVLTKNLIQPVQQGDAPPPTETDSEVQQLWNPDTDAVAEQFIAVISALKRRKTITSSEYTQYEDAAYSCEERADKLRELIKKYDIKWGPDAGK